MASNNPAAPTPAPTPAPTVLASLPPLDEEWRCRNAEHGRHQIFLSYRVVPDQPLTETLALAITATSTAEGASPLSVFLDKECLNHGEEWEAGFLNGLRSARLVVLVISEATLEGIKRAHERPDNVLLEYEVALELARERRALVLPVFVGRYAEAEVDGARQSVYVPFAGFNVAVFAEGKPAHPTSRAESVRGIMKQLFKLQGESCDPRRIRDAAASICKIYRDKYGAEDDDEDDEEDEEDGDASSSEDESGAEEIEGQTFTYSQHRHVLVGSELKSGEKWRNRWYCDVCGEESSKEKRRFSCSKDCDWDACESCLREDQSDDEEEEEEDEGEGEEEEEEEGAEEEEEKEKNKKKKSKNKGEGNSAGGTAAAAAVGLAVPGAWFAKMGEGLGRLTGRKRRFFVLVGSKIFYYASVIQGQPCEEKGHIALTARTTVSARGASLLINTPGSLLREARLWDLVAEDEAVPAVWERAIRSVIDSL